MNRTLYISILGGLSVLLFITGFALRFQKQMEDGLPERVKCSSYDDAKDRATKDAGKDELGNQRGIYAVVGTGSMVPYLPAAPEGKDPMATRVAFAITLPGSKIEDVKAGDLCIYTASWVIGDFYVIHQAAMKDVHGWIMSGLHNKLSESGTRVTADNFKGIVAKTYVWDLQ